MISKKKTKEIWKNIPEYEGLYQISNLGRVKGLDRYVKSNWGHYRKQKGKILSLFTMKSGYVKINLRKNNKATTYTIHKLVAKTFIPNTENKPQINHKNEIKADNKVKNLEWVTSKENSNHGTGIKRAAITKSKAVLQIDKKTFRIIKKWESASIAAKNGFNQGNISYCCIKKLFTHRGFLWRFTEDYKRYNEEKIQDEIKSLDTNTYNKPKKVAQINIKTNKIIKLWNHAYEAEKIGNFNAKGISACCNGKYLTSMGFKWRHI